MPDPRFHAARGPFTIAALAEIGHAELRGTADPTLEIRDVAPLDEAGPGQVSFIDNPHYVDAFRVSRAGACVVHPDRVEAAPDGMALLVSGNPYLSYALIAQAFYPEPASSGIRGTGVHVDASASIGDGVDIAPGAVVQANAVIGARCMIGPGAVIGQGVVLGDDCRIGAAASLGFCILGNRVRIAAGARIGEAGFGFATGPSGHVSVPQLGRVLIEDDVDIGANTTIDRGAGPDTVIGAGTRIDNLVQIGHNVRIGRGCIIVAQVGISGSTKLEDFVVLGGQVGLAGHLTIGKGAQLAAQSGVMKNVPPGARLAGSPAIPIQKWFRQGVLLSRLDKKGSSGNG
ncbi:MAG: UDP-3-O-(3-hydroxymyristoyl)glucosamine N-acyltransferase [Alphaproteobacteria bacterium]|nr:UDP-3-O-(3-hydroxymyristoyl)glucosamine N-acyltransferase [Alphaproteobacteria bacterium]